MTLTQFKAGAFLLALLFVTQLLIPLTVKAQDLNTIVKGVVKGTNGEPLVGASVVIRNEKTKFTSGTKTDDNGIFTFSRVPAGGPYSFSFSIVGYEPQTLSGYTIKQGTTFTLAVDMKAASGNID